MSELNPANDNRRNDLDALRAFAMLLGIALHTALSFGTTPWFVQDSRQSPWFTTIFSAIHGFRMQLFFLLSGFFTMMVYSRRGLTSLLWQRILRIGLPLLIGVWTIVPLVNRVSRDAINDRIRSALSENPLITAIRSGDRATINQLVKDPRLQEKQDLKMGVTPLAWAAMKGDLETVKSLIEAGANLDIKNRDGATPLHGAAFLGYDQIAEVLLQAGANPMARNNAGDPPLKSARADWGTTNLVVYLLGYPLPDRAQLDASRAKVRAILEPLTETTVPEKGAPAAPRRGQFQILKDYRSFLNSPQFRTTINGSQVNLFQTNYFDHLWFLWFLCWLVVLFSLGVGIAAVLRKCGISFSLPTSSFWRWLWIIPVTYAPQFFMGLSFATFGPDTSVSLLPPPHLLAYYGVFFAFGVLYYSANDTEGRLGRYWWLLLPAALFIAYPAGKATMSDRPWNALIQVLYTWCMCFGMMGLFRRFMQRPSKPIRYLSDASYWLYISHLPLVIWMQNYVREWAMPGWLKFLGINVAATAFLLVLYQIFVRYTPIGWLLNGRRKKVKRLPVDGTPASQPATS